MIILTDQQAVEFSMTIEDAGDVRNFLRAWLDGDWQTVLSYTMSHRRVSNA